MDSPSAPPSTSTSAPATERHSFTKQAPFITVAKYGILDRKEKTTPDEEDGNDDIAEQEVLKSTRQQFTEELEANLPLFIGKLLSDNKRDRRGHQSLMQLAWSPCTALRDSILNVDLKDHKNDTHQVPFPLSTSPTTSSWSELVVRLLAASINDQYVSVKTDILKEMHKLCRTVPTSTNCPEFTAPEVEIAEKDEAPKLIRKAIDAKIFEPYTTLRASHYIAPHIVADRKSRKLEFFSPYGLAWSKTLPHTVVIVFFDELDLTGNCISRFFIPSLTLPMPAKSKGGASHVRVRLSNNLFKVKSNVDGNQRHFLWESIACQQFTDLRAYQQTLQALFRCNVNDRNRMRIMQFQTLFEREAHLISLPLCQSRIQALIRSPALHIDDTATKLRQGIHPLGPPTKVQEVTGYLSDLLGIPLTTPQVTAIVGNLIASSQRDNGRFASVHGPPGTAKTTTMTATIFLAKSPKALETIGKILDWPEQTINTIVERRQDMVSMTNQAVNRACESLLAIDRACTERTGNSTLFTGRIVRYCHPGDLINKPALLQCHPHYLAARLVYEELRQRIPEVKKAIQEFNDIKQRRQLLYNQILALKRSDDGKEETRDQIAKAEQEREALRQFDRPTWANEPYLVVLESSRDRFSLFLNDPSAWHQNIKRRAESGSSADAQHGGRDFDPIDFRFIQQALPDILADPDTIIFHTAGQLNPYHSDLRQHSCRGIVYIDEAGQMDKMTTALVGANSEKMVLFGDAKQMPPWTLAARDKMGELATSLLEDVLDSPHHYILNVSFRLHPYARDYLNSTIYNEALVSPDQQLLWRYTLLDLSPFFQPLTWIDVNGPCNRDPSLSCKNFLEAEAIIRTLEVLDVLCGRYREPRYNVVLLSMYTAQQRLLQALLDQQEFANIDVRSITVETCQGEDVDIALLSMVTSSAVGSENTSTRFTTEPRFNVATSRAKYITMVFGSKSHWIANGNSMIQGLLKNGHATVTPLLDTDSTKMAQYIITAGIKIGAELPDVALRSII